MTDEKRIDDQEFEALFALERAAPPEVPDSLMTQILADAVEMQRAPRAGLIKQLVSALGGFRGMGGLITATCVGFWLGVSPPEGLPDLASTVFGVSDVLLVEADGLDGFGWEFEEGELDG